MSKNLTPPQTPKEFDMKTVEILADAVSKAIGTNAEADKRFIDISRIPLLCLSVSNIHKNIEEIKEMLKGLDGKFAAKLTEKIIYGLVSIILIGVLGAFLSSIIQQ